MSTIMLQYQRISHLSLPSFLFDCIRQYMCMYSLLVCFIDTMYSNSIPQTTTNWWKYWQINHWYDVYMILWVSTRFWHFVLFVSNFEALSSSKSACHQCHQIDQMEYPNEHNGNIHLNQKSFFLAANKFKQYEIQYKQQQTTLRCFSRNSFYNHFHVHVEILQVDV